MTGDGWLSWSDTVRADTKFKFIIKCIQGYKVVLFVANINFA